MGSISKIEAKKHNKLRKIGIFVSQIVQNLHVDSLFAERRELKFDENLLVKMIRVMVVI